MRGALWAGLGATALAAALLAAWVGRSMYASMLPTSDLYCGDRTCYEVLEVPRDAPAAEIRRAFRSLSLR
jgi:hypothetical protein